MKNFIRNNLVWIKKYFYSNKWIFEMLVFFFALQTFLYSIDQRDYEGIGQKEISALKIIFWILIFLIIFLLYVETDKEYTPKEDDIRTSIFEGSVLSKYFIRLLIYILFTIIAVIFYRQIKISFNNSYFIYFWIGLVSSVVLEILRIIVDFLKKIRKKK